MRHHPIAVLIAVGVLGGTAPLNSPAAAGCDMREAFKAVDTNSPGGRVSVLGPADDPSHGPVAFSAPLNVNTDGTRRSYSVDDPAGRSFALNGICNAMTDVCRGLHGVALDQRFQQLRDARDHGWPRDELAATRLSADVIPRQADGRVCPEIQSGGHAYLVSSTALEDSRAGDVCNPARYIDALIVPALVLQGGSNGFHDREIRVGDAVVAWRPGLAAPVYAVAGDTGPAERLGEGSIALNGALLGRTGEPANDTEVVRNYVVPKATVLIFPKSRDSQRPRVTLDRVQAAAREAFATWGGGSEAGGMQRLQACAAQLDGG